ncbi:hypothetical protein SYNTR_0375 [Candidatus Syntrophocurvum alkaliphilum]|uniref:Uncharacterized protein n=1 Tax=Candidatus Syntrophocurvum alkaliphilum TaxID=2293317 RepID=A0A6I6DEK1_9FIRM|nr:hypothetical protein [Candidatus Syntrophocurvum alkaliphilum]QGT98968.1 hypothetical protein SYNTR_0375 [Candidatus Syntrophocurvum alkaliphilum]
MNYITKGNIISAIIVTFLTFFIALLLSIGSETFMQSIDNLGVAFAFLLLIIFLGVFFDTIGTAATASDLPPFNAKAAKKVFGAKQAVKIARNADKVANYFNDVMGDIAGTLSGAIGAGIVFSLINTFTLLDSVLMGAVMTSFIASLTVGGKAIGKTIAVNYSNAIIFKVAIVMGWFEKLTGIELLN